MTNTDRVAAVLADNEWHLQRRLWGAVGFPEWFHMTIRAMVKSGLVEESHDPYGSTWYRQKQ